MTVLKTSTSQAQLVQYERALTAAISPGDSLPYNNSAYYDSQLSLPGHYGSRTPDNLSPSSTSGSEFDSRLTTPDTGADLVMPTNRQDKHPMHNTSQPLNTTTVIPKFVTNRVDDLSPMTATLRLTRSSRHPAETTSERTAFGSAQRKKEHRKTFSADFSKFPLGFTLHHEHSKT